jgi:hypothetical protein
MSKKPSKKPINPKRETAQVFDHLFKLLLRLSNRPVISFINGLFGAHHSLDAKVTYLSTESIKDDLHSLISDSLLSIEGVTYNVETQINYDREMVVRVFQYGYKGGYQHRTYDEDSITIEFPKPKVIYWELADKEARPQILHLKFPDGFVYDYKLESFNLLAHTVKDLEKRGLAIIIPFYILKLRKQVEAAKTSAERKKLAARMQKLIGEMLDSVDGLSKSGIVEAADAQRLIGAMDKLYKELFSKYSEFAEGEKKMNDDFEFLTDKILTDRDIAIAKNLLSQGVDVEIIAKSTGLSLKKVKALKAGLEAEKEPQPA